jgi:hypothetical protein
MEINYKISLLGLYLKYIKGQCIYSSTEDSEVVLVSQRNDAGLKKLQDKQVSGRHAYCKICTQLWTSFFNFFVSIRIKCNRISQLLLCFLFFWMLDFFGQILFLLQVFHTFLSSSICSQKSGHVSGSPCPRADADLQCTNRNESQALIHTHQPRRPDGSLQLPWAHQWRKWCYFRTKRKVELS